MITCTHYRTCILAEPGADSDDLREHRESCAICAAYTQRLQRFEGRLAAALRIDVGVDSTSNNVVPLIQPRAPSRLPRRWLAIAASFIGGIGIATFLWLGSAQPTLAAAVVAHMAHEPSAWKPSDAQVSQPALDAVLKDAGVRLVPGMGRVTYAHTCPFRSHTVPHLVVQTPSGPVTVMVLAHEQVASAQHFNEQGYQGMLVPVAGHGSIAVIMRGSDSADVQRIAEGVEREIQWAG
ncbi:MAG: DUF3379 family protein [Betaproteobacteria bacterium]